MQSAAARLKSAKKAAAAERKAEQALNDAVFAVRNQNGSYLDDDLDEAEEREAADWQALALILAGVGIGLAAGLLLAPRRR